MAKAFNMVLLMTCIAFVFFSLYQISPLTFGGGQYYFSNLSDKTNGSIASFANSLPISPTSATGLISTAALVVATVVFPNPYTLFAIPAAALLTFYAAYGDLAGAIGLPTELQWLFTIMGFAFVLYILGWYKGNE